MLKVTGKLVPVEGALEKKLFSNGVQNPSCKEARHHSPSPLMLSRSADVNLYWSSSVHPKLPQKSSNSGNALKVCAMRRRTPRGTAETYVLFEPGQDEIFVSEEELKAKLQNWLENWPGEALPPDLARFETIDDAVSHLIRSVCELEIDGNVGSIQWYQVRLE
ncbi:hypothetical protein FH972_007669 [Carpinus fangiana]|uniref:Chlororespiratory reduction 7 n=1 Tax=Carpinus fangiana TaxID=176857 RepID=A0A5N6QX64_9ROSI|nr:hypothetical protein FH972_007669 [Carpinus fangiana]